MENAAQAATLLPPATYAMPENISALDLVLSGEVERRAEPVRIGGDDGATQADQMRHFTVELKRF